MIIKYVLLNKLYEIKYLDNCIGLLVNEVLEDREDRDRELCSTFAQEDEEKERRRYV